MADGVETPELMELQDELIKTDTSIVNDLPSETESSEKAAESSGGLSESQKKNLPEALQKAILAKKDKSAEGEEVAPAGEMNISEAIPDDELTPVDPTAEEPFQESPEPVEPVVEVPVPEEVFQAPEPVVAEDKYKDIYAAHSLSQRVASMPLAEYEEWLFPNSESPDYLRGQMCLARVEASLKAANGGRGIAEPWQIKIGSALWSRLNYRNGDIETTRKELEKAPPMEVLPLIPRNASEAISVIEEIQMRDSTPESETPWGLIAACGLAVMTPLLLLRR
jgi:hypothetical protein|tara:strand:- start:1725 stop:2564 length:840 start_codon:yes stop_codon:yes gene_type:complete